MKQVARRLLLSALLCMMLSAPIFALENVSPAMAQAYLDEVNEVVQEYGVCTPDASPYSREGLAFIDLLDCTGDGVPELMFGFFDDVNDGNDLSLVDDSCFEEYRVYFFAFDQATQEAVSIHTIWLGDFIDDYHYIDANPSKLTMVQGADGLPIFCRRSYSSPFNYKYRIQSLVPDAPEHTIEVTLDYDGSYPRGCFFVDEELLFHDEYYSRDENADLSLETMELTLTAMTDEALAPYDLENGLMLYGGDGVYHYDVSLLDELFDVATQDTTLEGLMSKLPCVGDVTQMTMSRSQADAFAKVLENDSRDEPVYSKVAFFYGQDGTPVMWAGGYNPDNDSDYGSDIWCCNGVQAELMELGVPKKKCLYQIGQDFVLTVSTEEYDVSLDTIEYYEFSDNAPVAKAVSPLDSPFSSKSEWDDCLRYDLVDNGWGKKSLGPWADASATALVLRGIASSVDGIDAPMVTDLTEIEPLLTEWSAETGNEIVSVFDVGRGYFYVLVNDHGDSDAIMIYSTNTADGLTYGIDYLTGPLTQDEINKYLRSHAMSSNIPLDCSDVEIFNNVKTFTTTADFTAYLNTALDKMEGLTPTYPSALHLMEFLEYAISTVSPVSVVGTDNVLSLTAADVQPGIAKAAEDLTAYTQLLSTRQIVLDRAITKIIPVVGNQMDPSAPMELVLGQDLANSLTDETLEIYLGCDNLAIQISAEHLKTLVNTYGTLTIALQCQEDESYDIQFLDEHKNAIDELVAPVTVLLPCKQSLCIAISPETGIVGGRYSPTQHTLKFTTSRPGTYQLVMQNQPIANISEASEPYQATLPFMTIRGYFSTDDQGDFRRIDDLTPAEAVQALGGICPGFDGSIFQSGDIVTKEELLVAISQILVDEKGYSLPANPADYLFNIVGGDLFSEAAQPLAALAIREGVITYSTEVTTPSDAVNRQMAAKWIEHLYYHLEPSRTMALTMEFQELSVKQPEVTEDVTVDTEKAPTQTESNTEKDVAPVENASSPVFVIVLILVLVAVCIGIFLPKYLKRAKK